MKKKYFYRTQRELDGLAWTARVIDFGVSLTVTTALNELTTAYIMLREHKDVFRHKLKLVANQAMLDCDIMRSRIMSIMENEEFFDTYSDRVIDLSEDDVTMFRISIKQTLDDKHCKYSELISYAENARTMLELACAHFDSVIQQARKDYGADYRKAFYEFDAKSVYLKWQSVCDMLYAEYDSVDDIDLNTNRSIELFNKIGDRFALGYYIDGCMSDAMREHPDFINKIKVTEHETKGKEQARTGGC